ncbi:hypothetical protein FS837_001312 [Tulasnella sp. UAMH 9824]|nr:hypothetical protein FS837_001312 [Tulasnella sp. UAMH 9824]
MSINNSMMATGSQHRNVSTQLSTPPATSAQAIIQAEPIIEPLRIRPREVLNSLGSLRIPKTRIALLPANIGSSKAGGKADVVCASLLPEEPTNVSNPENVEYVAVKKFRLDEDTKDDRVLALLANEIHLLSELSHPNIVSIVGFVEDAGDAIAWMIFRWEENGNLREFIGSANWELPERLSLIYDVSEGLAYLHTREKPICHGDLKSLNILINANNRALITDFGSARVLDPRSGSTSGDLPTSNRKLPLNMDPSTNTNSPKAELAQSGQCITMTGPTWTLRWAAPELLEGRLPDFASDIWAFGWICWEAITGLFPFSGQSDVTAVDRICQGELPTLRDDADLRQIQALCTLMSDCWESHPEDRPSAATCQTRISWMGRVTPSRSTETRSAALLSAIAWMHLWNGRVDDAERHFRLTLEIARSAQDKVSIAIAIEGLGTIHTHRNENAKAVALYTEACEVYAAIGNQLGRAGALRSLGDAYYLSGQSSNAEAAYVEARDIFARMEDQLGFAQATVGLGYLYYTTGQGLNAEVSFNQALQIHLSIGNELGVAHALRGLGDVHRTNREYAKAEKSYIEARNIYDRLGSDLDSANALENLGTVYRLTDQYAKAESCYADARDRFLRIGYQRGYAITLQHLGAIFHARGEHEKGDDLSRQADEIYRRIWCL